MNNCKCGNEGTHEQWTCGVCAYFCCSCWVASGGIPADWHDGCLSAGK